MNSWHRNKISMGISNVTQLATKFLMFKKGSGEHSIIVNSNIGENVQEILEFSISFPRFSQYCLQKPLPFSKNISVVAITPTRHFQQMVNTPRLPRLSNGKQNRPDIERHRQQNCIRVVESSWLPTKIAIYFITLAAYSARVFI